MGVWGLHPRGKTPEIDPEDDDGNYPFPFHPLELGEAALLDLFGYQLEGEADQQVLPEDIAMMRFKRARSFWKFW